MSGTAPSPSSGRAGAPRCSGRVFVARRAALAGAAVALLALGGCLSIGGGDLPALTWYELEDRPAPAAPGAPGATATGAAAAVRIPRVLLIDAGPSNTFYDRTVLVYGTSADARAVYHFAGWTERPPARISQLVERRLAARGAFTAVAQSTAGIRGDLMLNLSLDQFYHDVSAAPGTARVVVTAELIDRRARTLVERRTFVQGVPVERAAADAAVAGLNRAVSLLIDELCPWVEGAAARVSPP